MQTAERRKEMETLEVLHMNKGVGETSYAMNSAVQNTIISVAKPATKKAIVQILCSNWPEKMGIADLGCSSGPNALRVISEILDAVYATTHSLDRSAPELVVYLNDLFTNDFNNIFVSLPSFYKKQRQEKGSGFGSCFVSAVPGTFYGRLFPSKSLHFVHSSSSLHWLSQVPSGLEDGSGRALNKGKIYISKSSPKCVVDAYSQQFKSDFAMFLASRSQEMVAGGRMVLSLMGRESMDPTTPHSCYQWELLARSLMTMVSEGLLEEEKVDSFDAPYYAPCLEEMELEIEKEGSFMVDRHEAYEIDWDGGILESQSDSPPATPLTRGERVARTIRAVVESMLESHFGCHIMDDLFRRVPFGLEDGRGRALNKGKMYISKSSAKCVVDAYSEQFKKDFSMFLVSRSEEIVRGGRMVLSLWGRKSMDPTTAHSCFQWDLFANALMTMVYEGLVEEEKVDSFNAPYYGPWIEEVKLEIEKEGSFLVEGHEAYEMEWEGGVELQSDSQWMLLSSGERVARTVRAVIEPMLKAHFGCHIMDELFRRYAQMMEDYLSKTRAKFINLVISLVKQG